MFGGQQQPAGEADGRRDRGPGAARRGAHGRAPEQRCRQRRDPAADSRRRPGRCSPSRSPPQNRNDEVKLSGAFAKLVDEDPALKLEHDAEMHQTLLWGQGEMHLRGRARPAEEQVQRDGRGQRAAHALPRDHPQGGPGARPAQEAVRRPRPVRRRQDRDPPAASAARASSSRTRSWAVPCRGSTSRRSRRGPADCLQQGPLGLPRGRRRRVPA